MSLIRNLAAVFCLLLALAVPALTVAAPRSSEEQAKALLQDAVDYFKQAGPETATQAFNDRQGRFVRGDLYVFVFGKDGKYLASGANPKLAGTDASALKDAEGKPIVQEMMKATEHSGQGAVDYVWLNRADNRVEHKHSLISRIDGNLIGVGYYTD
jgi:cytochrome c